MAASTEPVTNVKQRLSGRLSAMSIPRVRDFHDDDLDQVVRVWEESRKPEQRAVYGLAEVLEG